MIFINIWIIDYVILCLWIQILQEYHNGWRLQIISPNVKIVQIPM